MHHRPWGGLNAGILCCNWLTRTHKHAWEHTLANTHTHGLSTLSPGDSVPFIEQEPPSVSFFSLLYECINTHSHTHKCTHSKYYNKHCHVHSHTGTNTTHTSTLYDVPTGYTENMHANTHCNTSHFPLEEIRVCIWAGKYREEREEKKGLFEPCETQH